MNIQQSKIWFLRTSTPCSTMSMSKNMTTSWIMICRQIFLGKLCNSTHSQCGIVAIFRTILFVVNKEIWKKNLEFRLIVLKRDSIKQRDRDQNAGLICGIHQKMWTYFHQSQKYFMSGYPNMFSQSKQHTSAHSTLGISTDSSNVKNNVKRQRLSVDAHGPT